MFRWNMLLELLREFHVQVEYVAGVHIGEFHVQVEYVAGVHIAKGVPCSGGICCSEFT